VRRLPNGWECIVRGCPHRDSVGSENSCNGGTLETCPIASGFVTDEDSEALEIGRIVQRDGEHLPALRAYLAGKKRGQNTANRAISLPCKDQ